MFCGTIKPEVKVVISVFLFAFNAVIPLLLLLFLGYGLKRASFFNTEFLNLGNKLVFKLLLPMTIFHNIYEVEGLGSFNWSLVLFACVVVLLLCGLGLVAEKQKGYLCNAPFAPTLPSSVFLWRNHWGALRPPPWQRYSRLLPSPCLTCWLW